MIKNVFKLVHLKLVLLLQFRELSASRSLCKLTVKYNSYSYTYLNKYPRLD